MTMQFNSSSAYVPPTQADASLEAELARTLARIPPILRLPKTGTRCPYTQLSRTGLSELISPTSRNGGKPPVRAIYQRAHRYAQRGIWLIPAETLFRYILSSGTQPIGASQGTSGLRVACIEQPMPDSPTGIGKIHLN